MCRMLIKIYVGNELRFYWDDIVRSNGDRNRIQQWKNRQGMTCKLLCRLNK